MTDSVFVGRRDEQARFAALLRALPAGRAWTGGWLRRRSGEDTAKPGGSRVVLVHGLGGSGKTQLLTRFRAMADGNLPDSPVSPGRVRTVRVDWGDEQRDHPGLYAGMDGPSLVTVLDVVQRAVIDGCAGDAKTAERARRAFDDYRQGAARMPQYAEGFAEVIAQSRQAGSAFTSKDAAVLLRSAASVGLTLSGHPAGVAGLTPGQLAASAQAAGHISDAAVRALTGKKPGEITPQEYDLVTDPARELTRRAAAAVRSVAATVPLAILLDTGEVIGSTAWGWLRRVMKQTGGRVIWVVGARFETESEAGFDSPVAQFVRDIGDEHLVLMSPARFDDAMIADYLASRMGGRRYDGTQVAMVASFTQGLPLAVSLTSALLTQGQQVADVCRQRDGGYPSSVLSQLARSYLVHAEKQNYPQDDPRREDVTKILGLALAFADLRGDPELLAALWGVEDPLAAFWDLARRHDFVLPVSRRLHDEVRDILRADLLDPWRRPRARDINQRALGLFKARLAEMRSRWPALDDQLGHEAFSTALLSALWHTLWMDNQAGLDMFIQILPVLAAADPSTADAAAAMTEQFAATFDQDQRGDFDLLTETWPSGAFVVVMLVHPEIVQRRRVKVTSAGAALLTSGLAAPGPLIGEQADRQVAVIIMQARIQAADHQGGRAVSSLRTAAARTTSARLRRAIGLQAQAIAGQFISAGGGASVPAPVGLEAAKIGTDMLPGYVPAWDTYGKALRRAGRFEDALAAYEQALALDPGNIYTYSGRAYALLDLGRTDDALAAYDEAIAADPGNGYVLSSLGDMLQALGRIDDALAAYDKAIAVDPENAYIHSDRGDMLQALGRIDDALAAYDQAIAHDPGYFCAHENKGIALALAGVLDAALAELDTADELEPDSCGQGQAWAGAILWHRGDIAAARERFASVSGRVTGCTPFRTRELEAVALCALGQADDAEQRLLRALPQRSTADRAGPRTLYDLLSDPPLPGIERLRAIVDGDS